MSLNNTDKLIYPQECFHLHYSLNCTEPHRDIFIVLNLTSGKSVFSWTHKTLLSLNYL